MKAWDLRGSALCSKNEKKNLPKLSMFKLLFIILNIDMAC